MMFSTVVLKPPFSQSLSLHSRLSVVENALLEYATEYLAVTSGRSVGECDRLSQPSWLFERTIV